MTSRNSLPAHWILPAAFLVFGIASGAAQAQSPAALADSRLCSSFVDEHKPGARDSLVSEAGRADSVRAAFFRGCIALGDKHWENAATEFDRALKSRGNDGVLHLWLGRAIADQAEHASVFRQPFLARRVRTEFERSVALAPDFLDAHQALMQYALQAPSVLGGSIDRARSEAAEITRRDPYRGAFSRIDIEQHQKNLAGVEQIYRQLVAQYPDSVTPHLLLIGTLAIQHKWPEAWAVADDYERTQPRSLAAKYGVGRVSAESGEQLPRGERALREYLTHQPTGSEPVLSRAHWRLGTLLEREGKMDEAKKEYQLAVALEPNLRTAADALARMH